LLHALAILRRFCWFSIRLLVDGLIATLSQLAIVFQAVWFVRILATNGQGVQVAFLSLEAQTHTEVVVIIVFVLFFNWEAVRPDDVLKPRMAQHLGY